MNPITLFEEYPNIHVLETLSQLDIESTLLNNDQKNYKQNSNRIKPLKELLKCAKSYENKIPVKYERKSYGRNKVPIGRLYPKPYYVFQNVGQLARRLIIDGKYHELDIENS